MPKVIFTANLQRHIAAPPSEVSGSTVRAALESMFATHPRLRGYVLDDQGRIRRHVIVFVRGQRIKDSLALSDPVGENDEIFVMQSLGGG